MTGHTSETRSEPVWPVDAITVLNSLVGYTTFALFCLTLPLVLPLALVLPGGRRRWIAIAMRFAMRTVFFVTPGVSWRFSGAVDSLKDARVVVANHEGMLDILAACSLPGQRTLLAKTWVFRAFPLGVAARAAGLYNSDTLTPEDLQEGASVTLPDPRTGLFVFPEGRRSRDGSVDRFRPGAFVLARHLNTAVVPVAMVTSRQGICPGSMWIHPTRVRTCVLPPMSPMPDESNRGFAERVREAIIAARRHTITEMLAAHELDMHIKHRCRALPRSLRAAAKHVLLGSDWQVLTSGEPIRGSWYIIGTGAATLAMLARLIDPQAAIRVVATTVEEELVASRLWQRAGDEIAASVADLTPPGTMDRIVCLDTRATEMVASIASEVAIFVRADQVVPSVWKTALSLGAWKKLVK